MNQAKPEEKAVVGIAPAPSGGYGLVVGLSDKAWDYCKDNKTHNIDLNPYGIPLIITIFGCRSQQNAYDLLQKHNSSLKPGVLQGGEDFGIKEGAVTAASLKNKLS